MKESIPQKREDSREARMVTLQRNKDGTPTVWCDPEIADLVDALNNGKLATLASCGGHGMRPGWIALKDGRQLIVAKDLDEAREIGSHFPGVNGEPAHQDVDKVDAERYRWLRGRMLAVDFEWGDQKDTVLVFLMPKRNMAFCAGCDANVDLGMKQGGQS